MYHTIGIFKVRYVHFMLSISYFKLTYSRQPDSAMMELDRIKGDLGNMWQRWFIQIKSDPDLSSFKIIIEALVGDPIDGDIAIDDVVFHQYCQ